MATSDTNTTGQLAVRVEDYLSDKIQTAADLESVNDLLARVKEQQELLKRQLAQAKEEHAQAEETALEHTQNLRDRTNAFQRDQVEIDSRLQNLTNSEVSDDAVKIFESRMVKLRRLELATGYLDLLTEVDSLVSDARSKTKTPKAALVNHTKLRSLLAGLRQAQMAADQAAPHLVDQAEKQVDTLYAELRDSLQSDLQKTLERMSWPKKELNLLGDTVQSWQEQTESLFELQEAEIRSQSQPLAFTSEPIILLPLQILVKPLMLRFQYHFYGDRPTNRLDKPEYIFSHILDLLEQHSSFMTQLVQPIIDSRIQRQESLEYIYTDAISAFINALLPTVSAKCLSILSQVSKQPQLYSHFIHELMVFDTALRDSWGYTPIPGLFTDWRGLTYDMLDKHGFFKSWLETEKTFALSRYKKIRDDPDSNQIDYDTVEPTQTKPTKGAVRLNDLLETVTDRYRSLSSFSQKLTFLIDIQISIFDDYHQYLLGAFQAYVASSHTMGRLIQGASQSQDDIMGIKGLETLAKIFGSSEFLERKMSDWSEDIFFLELWDELQDRAKRNASTRHASVGRDLSLDDVAAKTSSSIKPSDGNTTDGFLDDNETGALFDETSTSFRTLRERAESEIVRAVETLARNALKPYFDKSVWSSLSVSADAQSMATSSTLDTFLSSQTTFLTFLAKVLSLAPLRRITRQISQSIQKEMIDNVVNRHTFSAGGAAQLRRDISAIQDMIDAVTSAGRTGSTVSWSDSRKSMRRLDETLILLNLPIRASNPSNRALLLDRKSPKDSDSEVTTLHSIDNDDHDEWGFDDNDNDNEAAQSSMETPVEEYAQDTESMNEKGDAEKQWSLWETEKSLFSSNQSARRALSAMDIEQVGVIEARGVIRRRIEIGSS